MKNPFYMPQHGLASFDGGGHGGGSKKGLVLKVLGGGCLVLFLVGALLTGLGVFKAVSCCSDIVDLATHAEEARLRSYDFGAALHRGDYSGAYELLTTEKRAEMTVEEFEATFEPWAEQLSLYRPWPTDLVVTEDDDLGEMMTDRRLSFECLFMPPDGGEGLVMTMVLRSQGEGEEARSFIEQWSMTKRFYDLQDHSYGRAGRRFVQRITEGRFEEARLMVPFGDEPGQMNDEEFEKVSKAMQAELGTGKISVERLDPQGANFVRVTLLMSGDRGEKRIELLVVNGQQIIEVVSVEDVEGEPAGAMDVVDEEEGEPGAQDEEGALRDDEE